MTRRKKTTRERQLARSAERRYQERRARTRRRILIAAGAVGVVVVVVAASLLINKSGGNSKSSAKGANGTPTITGYVEPVAPTASAVACGAKTPAQAGKPKPQYSAVPDPKVVLDSSKTYTASIETSCGTFQVELDTEHAPQASASFVFLAQHQFFDGLTFHRIVKGFMFQGGDPKGDGTGGPGYKFANELDPSVKFGKPGLLAMANAGPGTNGSQWFVTTAADTQLNPTASASYTIFGHVTKGMDVVDKINALPTTTAPGGSEQSQPVKTVYINKVTIGAF